MAQSSRQLLYPFVLPLLVASCARGEVDLGQGDPPVVAPRGARCVDSTVIDGAVVAHNQGEIAALAGCEEIHGDLYIRTFQGADLTPLSALRTVEGELRIGAQTGETPVASLGLPAPESEGPTLSDITSLLDERTNAIGWLTSLAGLEGLESVGRLTLYLTSVPDLLPLSHLRSLDSDRTGSALAGLLNLSDTYELRDLHGLEQAAGLGSLTLFQDDDLESLEGLRVPYALSSVSINGAHALADIDPLLTLGMSGYYFTLDGTNVANLDALSSLSIAQGVDIRDNAQLVDATGLNPMLATSIRIQGNPLLKTLSTFSNSNFSGLDLEISGNDSLESVALDFPSGPDLDPALGLPPLVYGPVKVVCDQNQALVSVRSTGGFATASSFEVSENEHLSELDLSNFQSITSLTIDLNSTLTKVDVPLLQTVNSLQVTNNPQLPTANFAAVHTFSSMKNGNADEAAVQ